MTDNRPICTCPEVDPVRRAATYTVLHMGLEPHAVTCPRHGHPIVEPAEPAEVEAGEVFLVVRAPLSQVVKARRLLHSQDWYKGSDVVVDPEFADDYYGVPVGPLVASLRSYWGQWKAAAQRRKEARR